MDSTKETSQNDLEVLREMETFIQNDQLVRKGITFEHRVEVARLQKQLERTLEESNPAIKKVAQEIAEIETRLDEEITRARDFQRRAGLESPFGQFRSSNRNAFSEWNVEVPGVDVPQWRYRIPDFEIPGLVEGIRPGPIDIERTPTVPSSYMTLGRGYTEGFANNYPPRLDPNKNVYGWADFAGNELRLFNGGADPGNIMKAEATLIWRINIPHDGTFMIRRQSQSPFVRIGGNHRVKGKGWWPSGYDASAGIYVFSFLELSGSGELRWGSSPAVSFADSTKSEDRTEEFSKSLYLPDGFVFNAYEGQRLQYVLQAYVETFANEDGQASVNITDFWIPTVSPDFVLQLVD